MLSVIEEKKNRTTTDRIANIRCIRCYLHDIYLDESVTYGGEMNGRTNPVIKLVGGTKNGGSLHTLKMWQRSTR